MPKFFPLRAVSVSVALTVLNHRMVRIRGVCITTHFFKQISAVALSLLLTCTCLVYALYLSIYLSMPHPPCRLRLSFSSQQYYLSYEDLPSWNDERRVADVRIAEPGNCHLLCVLLDSVVGLDAMLSNQRVMAGDSAILYFRLE